MGLELLQVFGREEEQHLPPWTFAGVNLVLRRWKDLNIQDIRGPSPRHLAGSNLYKYIHI